MPDAPPVYYTPDTLLAELFADLAPWVRDNKGLCVIASDPQNLLELLAEAPATFRVVLHWDGETNPADQPEAGCFPVQRLDAGVSINPGLMASPGLALTQPVPGRAALLKLVADVRERVRGHVFADEVSLRHPIYKGAVPAILPNGIALRAYRLSFELTLGLPPVEYRED